MNKLIQTDYWKVFFFIITLITISIFEVQAIIDKNWLFLGVVFLPLFFYWFMEKPLLLPFGLYAFLLPFDLVLALTGNTQGATLTKYLGMLSIGVILFAGYFDNRLKLPDKAAIWWVFFVGFGMLSLMWAIDPTLVRSKYSTAGGMLLLYLVVGSYQPYKSEFDILKKCIFYGGLIASLFSIYLYYSGQTYHQTTGRASLIWNQREADPNNIALSLLLPGAVGLALIIQEGRGILKILYSAFLGIILFGLILTGSRGGLLAMGVIMMIFIFSSHQRVALVFLILLIGAALVPLIPELFIERWEQATETGGSGRTAIWSIGLSALRDYWIIGAGLGNFPPAYTAFADYAPYFAGVDRDPHNIYLAGLVELGIIGFAFMFIAMVQHFRLLKPASKDYQTDAVMLKAAFWGILILSFFLTTLWKKPFWFLWTFILLYSNIIYPEPSGSEEKIDEKIAEVYYSGN